MAKANKGGRPRKNDMRYPATSMRFSPLELDVFRQCAKGCGISLASWIRVHLRAAAIKETGNKALFSPTK